MLRLVFIVVLSLTQLESCVHAHDTWVQTNTGIVRAGDVVHIDLMLGNHGNDQRDFKLAGKTTLDGTTLKVIAPSGKSIDLKNQLIDVGFAAKDGYWSSRFVTSEPGLYLVEHQRDSIANHGGPTRSIKSAKTFFLASKSLDDIPEDNPGFERVLGHELEIVPDANPVTPMEPEVPIRVKVLFKGEPLKEARVTFVPRGTILTEKFDADYERLTNGNGRCSFSPKQGNYYLVVVHHKTDEKGTGYDSTSYSATLTVLVPEICPCHSE